MTRWRPEPALACLTDALEAEILAIPEAELRAAVREPATKAELDALRARVARTVERAEEILGVPPGLGRASTDLRRP